MRGRGHHAAALVLVGALLGACDGVADAHVGAAGSLGSQTVAASPYVKLANALVARGVGVWVEADVVKAYLAGPDRYKQVLAISLDLARRRGVRGIKIADELGYHDGTTPDTARALVVQAAHDIHAAQPTTKVLIDVVVPELGCLSWTAGATAAMKVCGASARLSDPAASLAAIDSYVATGALDVVDLSAGLRDVTFYAEQGSSRDEAMRLVWREAVRRWGTRVTLQARKALARAGPYPYTAVQAEADVHTYVDLPLAAGAHAVDIWTWAQNYQGQLVTITDPGGRPNALTRALQERRVEGVKLWTHMTPSSLQVDLAHDVANASVQFDVVLVAAGTG
ncbi:MAG: hypothetical protein M3Y71_03335 [Actinomycetota bacterium]|nr:hypothetical protein [Actinomycetota bacterium]